MEKTIELERGERMAAYTKAIRSERPGTLGIVSAKPPITILAEGDSWFDYPLGTDVIGALEALIDIPIANMAHYGEEVRQMLALTQRKEIEKRLSTGAPNGKPWDAMLFSGGGNDFVGDQLCLWLNTYSGGMPPDQILSSGRFAAVMEGVRAGYQDLISMRDQLSKATKLFLHQYDFAPPNGRGVCNIGPWLQPSLDYRKVPRAIQPAVTHLMLTEFAKVLASLATSAADVYIVPTQGTIPAPTSQWWANELHPTDKGFEAIAAKFHMELKRQFPQLP